MKIHPSVGPVTTVRVVIGRNKKYAHYNADLIFVAGIPTVVIEWEERPEGDRPAVMVSP